MVLIKTPHPPPHLRLQTSNEISSLYKVKVIKVILVWKSSLVKEFIINSLLNPRLAHVISFLLIMVLMREPRD